MKQDDKQTCVYCGRVAADLVRMGGESSGRAKWDSYICNPDTGGCPGTSEEASWGGYLFGTLFYDIPFLLLGVVMIIVTHFVVFVPVEARFPGANFDILKVFFYGIFTMFPVGMILVTGLPIYLSPFILAIFSYWMIYG